MPSWTKIVCQTELKSYNMRIIQIYTSILSDTDEELGDLYEDVTLINYNGKCHMKLIIGDQNTFQKNIGEFSGGNRGYEMRNKRKKEID